MERNDTLAKTINAFRKSDPALIAAGVVEKAAKLKMEKAMNLCSDEDYSYRQDDLRFEKAARVACKEWDAARAATDAVLDTFLDTL